MPLLSLSMIKTTVRPGTVAHPNSRPRIAKAAVTYGRQRGGGGEGGERKAVSRAGQERRRGGCRAM